MSFTFEIASRNPIASDQFLSRFTEPTFKCIEEVPERLTGILHFYTDKISCRGVEIEYAQRSYGVRIMSASSEEDYQLAFNVARVIARLAKSRITGEDERSVEESMLAEKYDKFWIKGQITENLNFVLEAAKDIDGTVGVMGVFRDFYVGRTLANQLLKLPEKEKQKLFFDKLRRVQYIDEQYFIPKIMTLKDGLQRFVVWGPDVQYFFPFVQYFAIGTDDKVHFVPFSHLSTLAAGRITLLDEKQALVKPVPLQEWANFQKRAIELAEIAL